MSSTMSNLLNRLKRKSHSKHPDEQSFSIQPHPATSNDPADLPREQTPGLGGGLKSDPVGQAYHAKGPHVPSDAIKDSLEQPATREELQKRGVVLNTLK